MKTSFTPGPWRVFKLGEDLLISDDAYLRHLAKMVNGAPETEANARLIAKAPEMFDAIKDLIEAVDALDSTGSEKKTKAKYYKLIAEIEGES